MLRTCHQVLILGLAAVFAGCGGQRGPVLFHVTGKVTFNAAPVTAGSVNFYEPKTGKTGQGTLTEDGTYKLSVEAGSYQISICPPFETDVKTLDSPREGEYMKVDNIPNKYRAESSSGFTAMVADGKTRFDFDMK